MTVETPAASWRPHLGEYVRLRAAGTLGEVLETNGSDAARRYTLNLFDPAVSTPIVCGLDEIEPVWPEWTRVIGVTPWDEPPPAIWGLSWERWQCG